MSSIHNNNNKNNSNNKNNKNNKQELTEQVFDDIERGNNAHDDNDLWEAADAYGAASNLLRRLSSSLLTTSDEKEEEEDRIKALYQQQYVQYLKKGREALVKVLTEELSQQDREEDGGAVVVSLEERERRTNIFTRLYAFKEVEEEEKEESLDRSIEHRLSKLYIMQDDDNNNDNDTNDEKEEHPKSKEDQQASLQTRLDLLKQSHGPVAGRDDSLKERLGRLGVTIPKTYRRRDYDEAPLSNVQDDVDLIIAHAKDEARLEEEDRYASQDFDTSGNDYVKTVSGDDDDDITTALIDNQLDMDEGFKSMPNENDSAHHDDDDKEDFDQEDFDQDVEQLIASVQKQEEEESKGNRTSSHPSEVMTAKQPINDEAFASGSDKELANILVEAEQWQDENDDQIQEEEEEEDHHDGGGGKHAKLLHLIVQTRRLLLDAGDCLQITKDPKQQQQQQQQQKQQQKQQDDNEPNMEDANTTDDTKVINDDDDDDGVKHGKQILLEAKQKIEQMIAALD